MQRAYELLCSVGLEEHVDKLPAAVSGGQQQRVAIARALANDPPVIIADEPTGRLDSLTAEMIFAIFEDLVRQGRTILMVTHDHSLAKRMSRVIELEDGQIRNNPPQMFVTQSKVVNQNVPGCSSVKIITCECSSSFVPSLMNKNKPMREKRSSKKTLTPPATPPR